MKALATSLCRAGCDWGAVITICWAAGPPNCRIHTNMPARFLQKSTGIFRRVRRPPVSLPRRKLNEHCFLLQAYLLRLLDASRRKHDRVCDSPIASDFRSIDAAVGAHRVRSTGRPKVSRTMSSTMSRCLANQHRGFVSSPLLESKLPFFSPKAQSPNCREHLPDNSTRRPGLAERPIHLIHTTKWKRAFISLLEQPKLFTEELRAASILAK